MSTNAAGRRQGGDGCRRVLPPDSPGRQAPPRPANNIRRLVPEQSLRSQNSPAELRPDGPGTRSALAGRGQTG